MTEENPETKFENLLRSLPDFSKEELLSLRSRISVLINYSATNVPLLPTECKHPSLFDERPEQFYSSMKRSLRKQQYKAPPWKVFQETSIFPSYLRQMEIISPFLDNFNTLSRVEQISMYNIAADLIHRYLANREMTICLKTDVFHLHTIPSLFDAAFPGYLESGWLPFIVNALLKKGHE